MMKKLSVVILTYNQRDFTMRCLKSIRHLMADERVEVILVDNGSTDTTARDVKRDFPEVTYLKQERNLGVAAGRNAGLRRASGELLMLLDNDTVVPEGAIESLAAYMDEHPETGLVAPRLVSPQGEVQKSWKDFPGLGVKLRNVLTRGRSSHYAEEVTEEDVEPFYVIGAAQMFRREIWEKVGELDESIFYGPEDADFCMRVRETGAKVVYHPSVTIVHDWQRVTTRKVFTRMGRKHASGLLHFYLKHRRFW